MKNKVLSVAIPSYNMEAYLSRCLDSLCKAKEVLDELDIIVVNDGSKDRTSEIAHSYQQKYPESIQVIDKANGHYGSCVNAALSIAQGKYFRILDADDWFETQGLEKVVESLRNLDVDCVRTHYCQMNDEGVFGTFESPETERGKLFDLTDDNIDIEVLYKNLCMHMMTYRRAFLREIGYQQTQGICYTDTEYVYYPLSQAKSLKDLDVMLYCYYVARDEQSMNVRQLIRNASHFDKILRRMLEWNSSHEFSTKFSKLMKSLIVKHVAEFLMKYTLTIQKPSKTEEEAFRSTMQLLQKSDPEAFDYLMHYEVSHVPVFRLWYNQSVLAPLALAALRISKRRFYGV